ncbi:hypothetical protein EWM64_g3321 [Hericium alpestre]|uniref:Phytocyanin domain-containing protein n=1 Tax=Hericium alpestre TaxID=135208 RepID=A0A4Z0A4T8_9AGAM|nr:hypothetical protein EWM64_g3321 [Hericium alpestre]
MFAFTIIVASFLVLTVRARDVWVQVGHNTTDNTSAVFQPQRVTAELGDTVFFNFSLGNHTATQSTFSAPCVPAHDSDSTINGFNSMFRDAGNETAVTILSVPMLAQNVNQTMWFFDYNTCGQGGVGVINDNESSTATLAGFARNAIRLNGTDDATSTSSSASHTTTSAHPTTTDSSAANAADRALKLGSISALPLILLGLMI